MKIYGSIEKAEAQEDGTIIVSGFASSETQDSDGEVIKADAISDAIPDYMKFANIREMHDSKKAAGTALEMTVLEDGKTFLKAHIVDSEAVKKVSAGVYKGFSIGGRVTKRDATDSKIIKGIKLSEISLVDRPANPEAVFTFCKVDDAEGEEVSSVTEGQASGGDGAGAGVPAIAPAEKAEKAEIKKGMYGVRTLADILNSISWLQSDTQWEADYEKDGSGLPAALKAWLVQGGELLKDMVAEEVAEMTGANEGVTADVIVLADKAKSLMKAACSVEDADKFIKSYDALVEKSTRLAKAGARNSSADKKLINDIHAAAIALGADCGDETKAAGNTDNLQKVAKLEAENEELAKVCNALTEELKKFHALPMPSKAVVKVVEKNSDTGLADDKSEKAAEKPKTPQEALKKVWAGEPIIVN